MLCQRGLGAPRFPDRPRQGQSVNDARHEGQLVSDGPASIGSISRAVAWREQLPSQLSRGGLRCRAGHP
jgi:hypothetical protein